VVSGERVCWRVPMTVGLRSRDPIISAPSADEARQKALTIGREMVARRLPWLTEAGRTKPAREWREVEITVGTPIKIHAWRNH